MPDESDYPLLAKSDKLTTAKKPWQQVKGTAEQSAGKKPWEQVKETATEETTEWGLHIPKTTAGRILSFFSPIRLAEGIYEGVRDLPQTLSRSAEYENRKTAGQTTKDEDVEEAGRMFEAASTLAPTGRMPMARPRVSLIPGREQAPEPPSDVGTTIKRGKKLPRDASDIVTGIGKKATKQRAVVEQGEETAKGAVQEFRDILGDQQRAIENAVRGEAPEVKSPREAGEVVGKAIKEKAAEGRTAYKRAYDTAFERPGMFHAAAFEGLGNRLKGDLSIVDNPIIIDKETTPSAAQAIDHLNNISNLKIPNKADPFGSPDTSTIVGVDLRGVAQVRKGLSAYYNSAVKRSGRDYNNADVRATRALIKAFDDRLEQAVSDGLFTGDENFLGAFKNARNVYSAYQREFRPQGVGDDVGLAINRIVRRNATPEEIANMLFGLGKIGGTGLPVRIISRLENMFGRESPQFNLLRQGMLKKAFGRKNGLDELVGSTVGQSLFEPAELDVLRAYSEGSKDLVELEKESPWAKEAERVRTVYEQMFAGKSIGGKQGVIFQRIIQGTATPEEVAAVIQDGISNTSSGNVTRMLKDIKKITGGGSKEMYAARKIIWDKLDSHPDPKIKAQAIRIALDGKGKSVMTTAFTAKERAAMRQYVAELEKPPHLRKRVAMLASAIAAGLAAHYAMSHIPKPMRMIGEAVKKSYEGPGED